MISSLLFSLLLLLLLFSVVFGKPVVLETTPTPPDGWNYLGPAEPDLPLPLSIAVANAQGEEAIEQTLLEISTPGNERYAQHLSYEQVKQLVHPPLTKLNTIRSWLEDSGIPTSEISVDGDWIDIRPNVRLAEKLFSAKFGIYEELKTSRKVVRSLAYSLPALLQQDINFVTPIVDFPLKTATPVKLKEYHQVPTEDHSPRLKGCNQRGVTPSCVRELYSISPSPQLKPSFHALGIFTSRITFANHKDVQNFIQNFAPYATGQDFHFIPVHGGENPQNRPDSEANLDVEWSLTTGFPVEPLLYGPGYGSHHDYVVDGFFVVLRNLVKLPEDKLPQVLSISYGYYENQPHNQHRRDNFRKVCNLFARLSARGVSILAASGDEGTSSNSCDPQQKFVIAWPGSCPWVTAVGSTTNPKSETGAKLTTGGFSNLFKAPAYQKRAVDTYFKRVGNKTNHGLFDRNGRATPDIAALGENMVFVISNQTFFGSGTSFSAPIWAAVIALLNSERKLQGKPRLGFLNPWIYSQAYAGLNDITTGHTSDCGKKRYHWQAARGWDPVTGLGTPNYPKLRSFALST